MSVPRDNRKRSRPLRGARTRALELERHCDASGSRVALAFAFVLLTFWVTRSAFAIGCGEAAGIAESRLGLPVGLLRAIGRVETNNRPFAVDADGVGLLRATAAASIEDVRSRLAAGARFVDVGCFQIDLAFHPGAFASLEAAFDPLENAMVAGRFLLALRARSAGWRDAVARYHSAGIAEGAVYADRVQAALDGRPLGPPSPDITPLFGMRIVVPGQPPLQLAQARLLRLPVVQTP